MPKIKLIWDFRGPAAEGTAKHHIIHLDEFAKAKGLVASSGFHKASDLYSIAYIIVEEKDMITVRDALRPHRGETA